MATSFPTGLDSLTNPTSGDTLNSPSHSAQHADVNDAVETIEAKVGVDGSAVTTTHDYLIAKRTTALTAKGLLLSASAANTPGGLTVGANDTFLVADSGQTLGIKWANAATARTALALGTMATETAANYLPLVAAGAAVENIGAVESNVNTVATTGSTETLDTSVYGVHDCTMDQNCTFTFSNPAPSGKNTTFVLVLRGAFTPTLPASVKWSSGSVPTYTTPSVYVFTTVDAGTTYYATQTGKAFA